MDTDIIEQRENYPDHQIGFDTVIKTAHDFLVSSHMLRYLSGANMEVDDG